MSSSYSTKAAARPRASAAGFSLVEVMVALLVLSVGLIGLAALHGQGLSASRTAVYRTQAVALAADLADRIRANRLGQAAYAGAADDNDCDSGTECTPAEMAEHDLFRWGARVEALLPDGDWSVARDTGTVPPTYTITVQWTEVGDGEVEYVLSAQIPNS